MIMGMHTVVEPIGHHKISVWMTHLHVFLEVPKLVDAFLGERHKQHVDRYAGRGVVLRLHIRMFPSPCLLIGLSVPLLELGWVG